MLLILFLVCQTTAQAKVVDQIAAVVNDDIITSSELEKEAKEQYKAAMQNGQSGAAASPEIIRDKTLNSIIDRKLLEQKAKELDIQVTKEEEEQAFAENVSRSGLPRQFFLQEMNNAGFSEETYRKNLRASLLQRKLVSIDVQSKIVITEEMVKRYYQKHYVSEVDTKVYSLLQMGFTWGFDSQGRERSKEKALELARKVRADVLIGKDFAEVARKYSDLPSAADGGDIGEFTLNDMAEQMAQVVGNLRPTEVSKIIETENSYQFFQIKKMKKHLTVVKETFDNAEKEIRQQLYQEKLRQAYKEWISELKENAYIRKLH